MVCEVGWGGASSQGGCKTREAVGKWPFSFQPWVRRSASSHGFQPAPLAAFLPPVGSVQLPAPWVRAMGPFSFQPGPLTCPLPPVPQLYGFSSERKMSCCVLQQPDCYRVYNKGAGVVGIGLQAGSGLLACLLACLRKAGLLHHLKDTHN